MKTEDQIKSMMLELLEIPGEMSYETKITLDAYMRVLR